MTQASDFEIFLMAAPGLEAALRAQAHAAGFKPAKAVPGGVTFKGGWPDVWRANYCLRGAGRVIATIGSMRVLHLAQLDKRARKFPWSEILRKDVPVGVEVTCKGSRIYHSGAAGQRIATAIAEELGAPIAKDAAVIVRARIENDVLTLGVDTSGALLHKRGHKEEVAKAPMRETMASLFLQQCGYNGHEPVVDPMCGSGTFVIEAAEIALGLAPGRSRHFAFENLATFDAALFSKIKTAAAAPRAPLDAPLRFYGSDQDAGAVRMARSNAERAGVSAVTQFEQMTIAERIAPEGPPGLVIINPPYGDRIGDKGRLAGLYRTLGQTLTSRFHGWRVGLITNETALARATGLPFKPAPAPVAHGGLRVTLYQTGPLP